MAIIPWRHKKEVPAREVTAVSSLRSEVDRLFDRFFTEPWGGVFTNGARWMPSIDIAESEGQVIIKAEIPGVAPKDLEISLSGNTLYLRGEKQDEREEKGEQYYHVERSFGAFERALELPPGINPEEVNAEYNNGVVTITLKREQVSSRRKIPVVVAKS